MNKLSLFNMLRKIFITATFSVCSLALFAQGIQVTGTITDNKGESLPGATVVVKGTTQGTVADANGKFSITVPGEESVLVFSSVGYSTQEITVGSQRVITPQLSEGVELEEVVVTGMNVSKEAKKLGYAVTTIKAAELTKVGTPNIGTALYGKAAGVRIQSTPGGAAAGVSINVRGLSSITGNNQPFVVIDGVPIRNGNTGSNGDYAEFGAMGRIRSNGIVDINPEDIESLTILKGASATALYGSEAANGVIMITSKRAKEGKVSIDFSAQLMVNTPAYLPPYQTEYGPGGTFYAGDIDAEGFATAKDPNGVERTTVILGGDMFGPKYDGRDILYYDGTIRKYEAQTKDPWRKLYRNSSDQIYSLAVSTNTEKTSTRFSYTFTNEVPSALTGSYNKHNFKVVGNVKVNPKISLDYNVNYLLQKIHNRASSQMGTYNYFDDVFNSYIDVEQMKSHFQTSLGYLLEDAGSKTLTPGESFFMSFRARDAVRNILWGYYHNNTYEDDNRVIASIAPKIEIIDGLTLNGNLSTDMTFEQQEERNDTQRPIELFPTDMGGKFSAVSRRYSIFYGDVRLSYTKKIIDYLSVNAFVGWSGRKENMNNYMIQTRGGLLNRNWFSMNASRETPKWGEDIQYGYSESLYTAWFGNIGVEIGGWLFFEGTGRQEKRSSLRRGANSYFYPSVSASMVYTDLLKDKLPKWYNLGKLRASYAIVGNAPGIYSANVAYNQTTQSGVTYNTLPGSLGNDNINPEKKLEWEFGIENKLFNNRLGFEVSYYTNEVRDMILGIPQPMTSGIGSILMNAARMSNKGLEVVLYGTPIETKNFVWEVHGTWSTNKNQVEELAAGIPYLSHGAGGNHGGGADLRSYVGRPAGDFYTQVWDTDENGNYIIDASGRMINKSQDGAIALFKVGNAMPKFTGGLGTTISYKNWSLDVMTDFRVGGDVINALYQYGMALGTSEGSLQYRDEAHGGLAYYFENDNYMGANAKPAKHSDSSGPNGEIIYHNGMTMPGVQQTTGEKNEVIFPSDYFYETAYGWSTSAKQKTWMHSIMDNSYWKLRELALSYKLPESIARKIGAKHLSVSVYGRNLFYIYKTIKDFDVESAIGTSWMRQATIDGSTAATRTLGFSLRASF